MLLPLHSSELADLEVSKAKLLDSPFFKQLEGISIERKQQATAMVIRRMHDFNRLEVNN
jgi:hypothetical protein